MLGRSDEHCTALVLWYQDGIKTVGAGEASPYSSDLRRCEQHLWLCFAPVEGFLVEQPK